MCSCFYFVLVRVYFFFFKQKTAYEMRISDWSSDVCSSDLDDPRVRGGARDDDLRAVLERRVAHLVEVDALVARGDAVGDEVVELAARVDRRAVGEVPALVEAQPEHGVAGLQQRQVDGHVGVGSGVGLHVGRSEEHTSELQSPMRNSYA